MKQVKFSNSNHPECREDEVFVSNVSYDDGLLFKDGLSSWESIGWKSKRAGSVAYDIYGTPISGMVPVFVKIEEISRAPKGDKILKTLLPTNLK